MNDTVIEQWRQRADAALQRWLPSEETLPRDLHRAMRYAVFNGGKRIRPVLTYAAGHALSLEAEPLDAPAAAMELIHAYSLVHDDLPAMDDDDLRRGQPTVHKAFDEATAILCGDALQSLAFFILARHLDPQIPAQQRLQMIEDLALASGSRGMAGGQAIDLAAVGQDLNVAELENMHVHKTGALIRTSVKLGALCRSGIDETALGQLDHYAKCIGLAFQIQDDVLDVEGDTQTLGKTHGADLARNKPTYPALLGLDDAKRLANELIEDALHSLAKWDEAAEPLRGIARYIVQRQH
ncbi:(2E,6E)-farnesyl diphosphate synthase [Thiohalophilus sp.]|uniref:(2E,6E)-farnesyl diphosphate synthase n=1 Tax=Thiohalophilus sp. TaxID=3028392 RepID=UPI002ACD6BC2|nr:farnesyl diphosphate synthase [Thiohalophilus sp.]MDZ7802808.1 farnesyl diphosphate synthase [Thiohalophilus sp.]